MKLREVINRFAHRYFINSDLYEQLEKYENTQYWSKSDLEAYQLQEFKTLVNYAKSNSPYYTNLLEDLDLNDLKNLDDLNKIPVLEKDALRSNIDAFKPKEPSGFSFKADSTSGSSGKKLIFHREINHHAQAIHMRSRRWMGLGLFPKTYTIWGASWDVQKANKSFKNRIKNWLKNSNILSGYNLSDADMNRYLYLMKRKRVVKLVSYPSILYLLAEYAKNNNIKFSPKVIVTGGERLYDYQREFIESVFDCKVYNLFGSRDIPLISQECEQGRIHIMSEQVLVEVQTDEGEIKREGEGDLIVTHFHNRATPFIRYRNGDRVKLSNDACPCGRQLPLMDEILGRSFEVIEFPNGNRVGGSFWTLVSRSVNGIDEFEVIQKKNGSIVFRFVSKNEIDMNQLKANITQHSGQDVELRFERVDEILLGDNGKRNFVKKEK